MHSKKNPQLCTVRKNRIQTQKIVNMKLRIELRKDARLQAVSKPGLLPVFADTASRYFFFFHVSELLHSLVHKKTCRFPGNTVEYPSFARTMSRNVVKGQPKGPETMIELTTLLEEEPRYK